jgi:transforming growth factor-beta-induced protein
MSRSRPFRLIALIVTSLLLAAACAEDDDPTVIVTGNNPLTAPRDVVGTIDRDGHTILVAAIDAAGLTEDLRGEGPFTLFAPTDGAFEALPDGLIPLLLEPANRGLLVDILTFHVAEGQLTSPQLLDDGEATSLEGSTITVETVEEPAADPDGEPTFFVEVAGQAEVSTADTLATNGVVHTIDAVLVPESRADDLADLIDSIPETVDAVSTLEELGDFDTLLDLVQNPDLDPAIIGALTGEGPFTLFAPTDAAFEALPEDKLEQLLADPELLAAVLQFHVVPRAAYASSVSTEQYFTTLEGQGARLVRSTQRELDDDDNVIDVIQSWTFAGVDLAEVDIEATNGIIHVIDQVLIPDSVTGPGGL